MASSRKLFPIMASDYELFEEDLCPSEYEYFLKHIQAFRSMWQEKSLEDKVEFVDEFFKFSKEYGYIKDIPLKMDSKRKFFDQSKEFLTDQFAKAKYSVAKGLVPQIAIIARNREKIFQHGSVARGKDPFFNVETRDTFRTFFGEPGHPDTFKKAVANMPLYTRFGGALCRVLRRWVEGVQIIPDFLEGVRKMPSFVTCEHHKGCCHANKGSIGHSNKVIDPNDIQSYFFEDQKPEYVCPMEEKNSFINDIEAKKEHGSDNSAIEDSGKKDSTHSEGKEIKTAKSKQICEESGKRLHHCGYCFVIEDRPKMFKKCSLCKGKGTRFYCCKECQRNDWLDRHRQEHVDKANQTNINQINIKRQHGLNNCS